MAYFEEGGKKVAGRLASVGRAVSSDEIAIDVAEAVGRCQDKRFKKKGRTLKELKRLFETYPQLKSDAWGVGEHPVSPLIDLYVKELFS